jgi:NADP-dependent 3-hydroxy acid dehydrogenase YdfG
MATAFVTGASYGVGAATALALARDGFAVAVSARRADSLASTLAQLKGEGARAIPVVLDLRAPASIEAAFAAVVASFGTLDVLVNNATCASAPSTSRRRNGTR